MTGETTKVVKIYMAPEISTGKHSAGMYVKAGFS